MGHDMGSGPQAGTVDRMADDAALRARRRSGIPAPVDRSVPWIQRFLSSYWTWGTVALLAVSAVLFVLLHNTVVLDREVPGGVSPGMGVEAFNISAAKALWSAVPLVLIFILIDRWRPQRIWIWLLALAWGGCVATYGSMQINTWAAEHLSIAGSGDPATATRAAVFVAPFVEESLKGSVLFLLAILMRYQWVSRLTAVSLAGLSATGFAYTENILYYGRVYAYAASNPVQVTPEEALDQIFFVRGVMTPWAHPLFTVMLGLGLGLALRSRSKTVRVVGPLAGFATAALLHMAFNASASVITDQRIMIVLWVLALNLVFFLVGLCIKEIRAQGRLLRLRLAEYVQLGWLLESDVYSSTSLGGRCRALWHALWEPIRKLVPTIMAQRRLTELAYLRDAIERGIVDEAGLVRENEILSDFRGLRTRAVLNPIGSPNYFWQRRRPSVSGWAAPHQWAPPSGVPVVGATPVGAGAQQYSAVDPSWGPPQA